MPRIPKQRRADLHERLAAWLEQLAGAPQLRDDEIVGYHLEQSYLLRAALGRMDADGRAAALGGGRLLGRAGRRVLDRDEFAEAAGLLERACRLLAVEPAERAALLIDLGHALRGTGALDAAEAALAEAIEDARRHRDEPTELRAEMEHARLAFMRAPSEPDVAAGRRAAGDRGLRAHGQRCRPRRCLAAHGARGARGARPGGAARGAPARAPSRARVRRHPPPIEAWNEVGGAMIFGRTPVTEALAFVDEELAWARERGLPALEADALLGGPYVYARLGRFDEARDRLERSKAICRELGIAYGLAEAHMAGAELEMLAGDPEAAEQELRDAIAAATEMGASRYIALYRTRLAHVLVALGRDADALVELEAARPVYESAPKWKAARARVLARRGQTSDAVEVAREAVESMAGTDDITAHAEVLVDLAEVLRVDGDLMGAQAALAEALALHEQKGNLVSVEWCRRLLAELQAGGAVPSGP